MKKDYAKERWMGYLRKNGAKGIRNKVIVIYTVKCASFVAEEIVRRIDRDDVELIGFDGCMDSEYGRRMLVSAIRNPNVGGVVAVGLGCEFIEPEKLADVAKSEGKPSDWLYVQQHNGTEPSIVYGMSCVLRILEELRETPMVEMGFSDLVVGSSCGGSDYTSGLAGNVLAGKFFDRLLDMGGTGMFEEITEAIGLVNILSERAANDQAREELIKTYNKGMDYCKAIDHYSISPGNFAGGLSTIEEKSMGAVQKSGTHPIDGVLKVSQTPPHNGLWLVDNVPDPYFMQFGYCNPFDNEGLFAFTCSGCQLSLFITGRGSVVGGAITPLFKITGNSTTYANLSGDMDLNAGVLLSGEATLEDLGDTLCDQIIEICKGGKTNAEKHGHKEYYIPYKYQEAHSSPAPACQRG